MKENNFWAELDTQNTKPSNVLNGSSFWDALDAQSSANTQPQNPTIGNRVASGGKAIVAGAGGAIPDTAALAYNLPVMGINKLRDIAYPDRKKDFPLIPSATEAIDRGIDTATSGYTNTPEDQKHINEALKFGASVATGGGLAKGSNKVLSTVGKFTGSTDKAQIAGAAAAGGTMSYLNDQGVSTAETLGGGLAANIGVNASPNLAKGGGNLLAKGTLGLVGLGKGKLNLEAAKAAQDLDIALPKAAASEGKVIALADQFLSKAPIAGNIMQKRYLNMANKVTKELDNAYDSVISSKELVGIEDRIDQLYTNAKEVLPKDSVVVPQKITTMTENIKNELAKSASLSAGEKKVLSVVNDYEEKFAPYGIKRIPSPVEDLVASQDSLSKVIDWKDTNVNWLKEKKAASYIKKLHNAISNDLAEYGKKNPDWYNYYKQADNLFSKKSKRQEVQDLFSGVENAATGELSYNSLSKILHDEQTKNRLKKITSPETFNRLEKLGTVARSMAIKNKNLPNPSGTASTIASANVIGGMVGVGSYATAVAWPLVVKYIITAPTLAHFLTDKKSLDLAIKFAENSNPANTVKFSQRMKAITGYTPVTLLREAQKLEQENQEESSDKSGEKFDWLHGWSLDKGSKRIEDNKAKPKGQALNKLLDSKTSHEITKMLRASPFD